MSTCVVTGALVQCSFGVAPTSLNILPMRRVMVEGQPLAAVADIAPGVNIMPFGTCSSLANPTVAAATAAALGVLTPMPCLPLVAAPWAPGAMKTTVGNLPVLVSGSTCNCVYGGVITLLMPGAFRTTAG